jgi:hypothetical protein
VVPKHPARGGEGSSGSGRNPGGPVIGVARRSFGVLPRGRPGAVARRQGAARVAEPPEGHAIMRRINRAVLGEVWRRMREELTAEATGR